MGSYCYLSVAGQHIDSTKNGIDPVLMLLFRATDRVETVVRSGTPEYERYFYSTSEEDREGLQVHYRATCAELRDRLELLGFSRPNAERAFQLGVDRELAELDQFASHDSESYWTERRGVYKNLTPASWLSGVAHIVNLDLASMDRNSTEYNEQSPIVRHMLENYSGTLFSCPVRDIRHALRLVVDAIGNEREIDYDLTYLIGGGWIDIESDVIGYAESLLKSDIASAQRVIVLTEGSSDKWILQNSLELLAPHLSDYFTFMDFEGAKVLGGSGALANTVKAFIGAGIINRVVAIFDNDTAAAEALRPLELIRIPSNFAIVQYPSLEQFKSYPTLGPTGVVHADVNGVAASIELYLGTDVLATENQGLAEVHWRGYNEQVGRYQGVVRGKADILERFRNKGNRCRAESQAVNHSDWSAMRAVIEVLTQAAADTARSEIMQFEEAVE